MRNYVAIIAVSCLFLAGCQNAYSTPAPVTVTKTATKRSFVTITQTVTVSVTPSVSATSSATTATRTANADMPSNNDEPYDAYSYEDDYGDDGDSEISGYHHSEPRLFMHRNPGNNAVPRTPRQKRYNSTPNSGGGSKSSGGTGSGRSSSGGSRGGGRRR